jgi:hypothetical protein
VTRERDEQDAGDRATEGLAEPFARDGVEDVFEGGRVDPSVVEASVDALFEQFEEDTPEEVMVADRYPSEADVVPTPPAFDEFAAAVDDRLPERSPDDPRRDADDPVPDPDDVVGFEDAPEPPREDDTTTAGEESVCGDAKHIGAPWSTESVVVDIEEWSPADRPAAARGTDPGADAVDSAGSRDGDSTPVGTTSSGERRRGGEADGAFEWVSEPVGSEAVVSETVLADPERARAFAGEDAGEDGAEGVLSRIRSSFPF